MAMYMLAMRGEQRVTALHRTGLLVEACPPPLMEVIRGAARLTGMPMAALALFDADRMHFIGRVGFDVEAIARADAPCDHIHTGSAPCAIADMPESPALPDVRTYAGVPLIVGDGQIVGCLCVMGREPHAHDSAALESLTVLARVAAAHFEQRLHDASQRESNLRDLEVARDDAIKDLEEISSRLTLVQRLAHIATWDFLIEEKLITWSDEIYTIFGVERGGGPPTTQLWKELIHPDDRARMTAAEVAIWEGRETRWDEELRIVRPDGDLRHVWTRAELVSDGDGRRLVGTVQDITERKLMEAELSTAVTDMAMAGELAKVGAWSVDLVNRTVSWSDEIYAIHEVPVGTEISIDGGMDYFAPETRKRSRELFEACAQDGIPFDAEQELITATGRRIWVRGIGMPVRDAQGRIVGIRGAFQDIDALKRSEQEVRRLADRLKATLESITEGFMIVDRDWRFVYINGEAARWAQRERDELLGKIIWDEFPNLVGSELHTGCLQAVRGGESVSFDDIGMERGASRFSVRIYPSSEGVAIYFQNVTEAHDVIDALRESEARFKLVARAAADTIWDYDIRAGSLWWSDDFAVRLGYEPEEMPPSSENWRNVVHPDDLDRVMAEQNAAYASGADSWNAGYRLIRRDGTILHVLDRAYLMRDSEGRLVREVGGTTDISQRLEYEERLHQSQRLESIGLLTGGIAHDFNNLLTVILGNAELLLEGAAENERQQRLLNVSLMAAQRGANLTSRLLAFARRQALRPQTIDVSRLIAGMDDLLRRTIGGAVEVDVDAGDDLRHVLVDPTQLESAILNLCINARDAMPNGGRLAIEACNAQLGEGDIGTQDIAAGPYVMVSVSDTGTGMSSEVVAQAFEPFFTTKEVSKGSGLGLSVIYGFMRQSGGHVTIESEVDMGTVVRLYLPPAAQRAEETASEETDAGDHGGTEHVLVVEDDELVRDHVTAMLSNLGYAVVAAPNGPEALKFLRSDAPIDLLFTDVVMPGGMNGRQLADAARELRPDLPVLFTSGYAEDVIGRQGGLEPGIQLINKPYRRADVARKLRQVLDGLD